MSCGLVDDTDGVGARAARLRPTQPRPASRSTASTPTPRTSSALRRAGARSPPRRPSTCRSRFRPRGRREPSAPTAASVAAATTSTGAWRRTPVNRSRTGRSRSANRALVTRSGRWTPELLEQRTELAIPQRTITASRSRANVTNASATRVRARPAPTRARSRVSPRDPGRELRRAPGGEVRLDRGARDERHAVAGLDRAPHGLLQAELEPARRGRASGVP